MRTGAWRHDSGGTGGSESGLGRGRNKATEPSVPVVVLEAQRLASSCSDQRTRSQPQTGDIRVSTGIQEDPDAARAVPGRSFQAGPFEGGAALTGVLFHGCSEDG